MGLLDSLYEPEVPIIRGELEALRGGPWHGFQPAVKTFDMRERVVEVPWVLSRYAGEDRVLDIGTVNALAVYVDGLLQLRAPELVGLDLSPGGDGRVNVVTGDVRTMPFEDGWFDLVICVSTLEHVGADNRRYGYDGRGNAADRDLALAQIRRVLRPGGRALLTMPFGRSEEHDWFTQYDWPGWQALVRRSGLEPREVAAYVHTEGGWTLLDDPGLAAGISYGEAGAPAAGSVICADLYRPA